MAKISIIIPVYNVEKYLQQCIDSLLSQTLSDIEIICIDDASQDASGKILNDYAARDDRMKVIHADENMGTLRARIKGITDAAGQYVMFVDSDDYLEVSACEELLKLLTEHPVDVLHFGTVLHANENVSDDLKNWVTNFLTPYEGELEGNLIEKCFVDEKFDFNITNKIWRREVCEEAFANVEQIRLVASEDRYIFFLLMYYAKNYYGIIEKYYNYNLGIGVTGGDILSLDQFEKRCSGAEASELVKRFLEKTGSIEKFRKESKCFADKILWDCVDCWHNKLEKKDEQQGFEILRKYFRPDEITSAVARVYFEQGQDIYNRAKITGHKKIAIYYRYLGYDNMDEKVLECMQYLIQRGNDVILYTDQDRKELTEGTDKYGKELVYLPDAVSANWGDYEARCNAFYKQMLKDKIEVLVYASPTSHICWLDTLLSSLSDIVTVDMQDEVYLNMFGEIWEENEKKIEEKTRIVDEKTKVIEEKTIDEKVRIIDELQRENNMLKLQQESPRIMWKYFWRSLKNKLLRS